jgi:hypothetical protein
MNYLNTKERNKRVSNQIIRNTMKRISPKNNNNKKTKRGLFGNSNTNNYENKNTVIIFGRSYNIYIKELTLKYREGLNRTRITYLPSSILKFKQLKKLVVYNEFKNIPSVIFDIITLKELHLIGIDGNSSIKNIPMSIYNLINLKKLTITRSRIEKINDNIGTLQNLVYLDLNHNNISPNVLYGVYALKNLLYLDLSHNGLNTLVGSDKMSGYFCKIDNLENIKFFNVSYNFLTDKSIKEICKLKNLLKLNLSYNEFISLPDDIENLINLEELDLSGNDKMVSLPKKINKLKKLKKLNLKGNRNIKNIPISILELSPKLEIKTDSGIMSPRKFYNTNTSKLYSINKNTQYVNKGHWSKNVEMANIPLHNRSILLNSRHINNNGKVKFLYNKNSLTPGMRTIMGTKLLHNHQIAKLNNIKVRYTINPQNWINSFKRSLLSKNLNDLPAFVKRIKEEQQQYQNIHNYKINAVIRDTLLPRLINSLKRTNISNRESKINFYKNAFNFRDSTINNIRGVVNNKITLKNIPNSLNIVKGKKTVIESKKILSKSQMKKTNNKNISNNNSNNNSNYILNNNSNNNSKYNSKNNIISYSLPNLIIHDFTKNNTKYKNKKCNIKCPRCKGIDTKFVNFAPSKNKKKLSIFRCRDCEYYWIYRMDSFSNENIIVCNSAKNIKKAMD